jgi:spermidine synthase
MAQPCFLDNPCARDIAAITALYRAEGWWEGPDDPSLVGRLVAGSHAFLVLREGPDIVAMGRLISDRASDGYIQDLTVRADRRGRGLGTLLAETLANKGFADGLNWIGLVAERGSAPFYTRLGFQPMENAAPMLLRRAGNTGRKDSHAVSK